MIILCDKGCKKQFELNQNSRIDRVDNNVELIWTKCPICGHEYLMYASNNKIKMLQDKVRVELKKSKINTEEIEQVKLKIANEQKKLRRKYDNV